ncbi:hypothetical protein CISG_04653 [Coccidioides immitis RMSCC 3703]|uniref:Uncharacterized protein n=2 Tax=Coccidioides immitis TaxID=5501 RepID=A0A0J8QP70_COCIT|nr:hypothetical protein CIRG_01254 [Coccidioides immitis RMSCC 2394]KMU74304.1 hypothetical protein CISG_04653 [Coccidioides immitis RMSCC 3703]
MGVMLQMMQRATLCFVLETGLVKPSRTRIIRCWHPSEPTILAFGQPPCRTNGSATTQSCFLFRLRAYKLCEDAPIRTAEFTLLLRVFVAWNLHGALNYGVPKITSSDDHSRCGSHSPNAVQTSETCAVQEYNGIQPTFHSAEFCSNRSILDPPAMILSAALLQKSGARRRRYCSQPQTSNRLDSASTAVIP